MTKTMLFIGKVGLLALALVALPVSYGITHGKFFSTNTASANTDDGCVVEPGDVKLCD